MISHTSIDNYNVKYSIDLEDLINKYIQFYNNHVKSNTEIIVFPETAIPSLGWVDELSRNTLIYKLYNELDVFKKDLTIISGAILFKEGKGNAMSSSLYSETRNKNYFPLNTALHIKRNESVKFRSKEGLVPIQEYIPYPKILSNIEPVGVNFTFGRSKNLANSFVSKNLNKKTVKSGLLICYELVYSNLFRKAVNDGANILFVLLNEGWYDNLSISKHFLKIAKIRAIEYGRYIGYSSNGGISALISERGGILAQTYAKEPDFLHYNLNLISKKTIYTLIGDILIYIISFAWLLSIIIIFLTHQKQ